jgi:fatty acid desaturase
MEPQVLATVTRGAEGLKMARRGTLDLRTFSLFLVFAGGLVMNLVGAGLGRIPLWVAAIVSVALLNCSFTVWHEAVHGTISRNRIVNNAIGYVAAWLSMIPFFKIREIHWQHHQYTNDPVKDPDYWFTDGPFWKLPFRYLGGLRRYAAVQATPALHTMDVAGQVVIVAIFALSWYFGFAQVLLFAWLLPKIIALFIHAWYVNYLPHRGCATGQFQSARVIEVGWIQPLVLFHNYHGFHHVYQSVPWHRYRRSFEGQREFFKSNGTPLISTVRLPMESPIRRRGVKGVTR